jgi:uncharacterized oligopeptide transporter (OPT) family protein
MNQQNPIAGLLAVAFSGFMAWYLTRAFWSALANGYSPGKLGATHLAGSPQYVVFLGGCLIGLAFAVILTYMGFKWLGVKIIRS